MSSKDVEQVVNRYKERYEDLYLSVEIDESESVNVYVMTDSKADPVISSISIENTEPNLKRLEKLADSKGIDLLIM